MNCSCLSNLWPIPTALYPYDAWSRCFPTLSWKLAAEWISLLNGREKITSVHGRLNMEASLAYVDCGNSSRPTLGIAKLTLRIRYRCNGIRKSGCTVSAIRSLNRFCKSVRLISSRTRHSTDTSRSQSPSQGKSTGWPHKEVMQWWHLVLPSRGVHLGELRYSRV